MFYFFLRCSAKLSTFCPLFLDQLLSSFLIRVVKMTGLFRFFVRSILSLWYKSFMPIIVETLNNIQKHCWTHFSSSDFSIVMLILWGLIQTDLIGIIDITRYEVGSPGGFLVFEIITISGTFQSCGTFCSLNKVLIRLVVLIDAFLCN